MKAGLATLVMRQIMNNLYSILADWYPEGNYTEADLWEAIAESEGLDVNDIMDRDLAEFI
jgi:hypothetical protein